MQFSLTRIYALSRTIYNLKNQTSDKKKNCGALEGGPMRDLELIMWPQDQWEAQKNCTRWRRTTLHISTSSRTWPLYDLIIPVGPIQWKVFAKFFWFKILVSIWVSELCHNLSSWVLSQFQYMGLIIIQAKEFFSLQFDFFPFFPFTF